MYKNKYLLQKKDEIDLNKIVILYVDCVYIIFIKYNCSISIWENEEVKDISRY